MAAKISAGWTFGVWATGVNNLIIVILLFYAVFGKISTTPNIKLQPQKRFNNSLILFPLI
jgi:hypothetical protein